MRTTLHPPFFRRAVRKVSPVLLSWAENRNDARMDRNGGAWLLRALVKDWARRDRTMRRVVFEVGANRGGFASAVLAAAEAQQVPVRLIACEPGPSAFPALASRFVDTPDVTLVRSAVSDFEGTAPLLDAGHRLRDFFDLLTARGYRMAKLFPRWIELRDYQEQFDNFYYSNWLAVAPLELES